MSTISTYTFENQGLEELADTIKAVVVNALVKDGFVDAAEADEWCATHGIILRKKSIFRTFTPRWKNAPEYDDLVFSVVEIK